MNKLRAILFDLDGTLIDTTGLILGCFDHAWQTVCGSRPARDALIQTFGIPLREAMKSLLALSVLESSAAGAAGESEVIEHLLAEYRLFNVANHDSMARPFEGVRQVIAELRSRGYAIGVVTSKSRELACRGLSLCSLDGMIDESVFLEDTERHKPQPDPISRGLEKLNALPSQAAYVGDSRFDIMAGRAAGVRTIAALWGPAPRHELEREQPDFFAKDVTGLLEIFE
jgi:pyrophosphatase PpaX